MTHEQAIVFLEDYDLRVLVLPQGSGYAVFRLVECAAIEPDQRAIECRTGESGQMVILPGERGFVVLGPNGLNVLRPIARGQTFDVAVENASAALGLKSLGS